MGHYCRATYRGRVKEKYGKGRGLNKNRCKDQMSSANSVLGVLYFCTRDDWKRSEMGAGRGGVYPFGSACFDVRGHNNRSTAQNKKKKKKTYRGSGLPRRGGLSWVPLKARSGLFAVRIRLTQRLGRGGGGIKKINKLKAALICAAKNQAAPTCRFSIMILLYVQMSLLFVLVIIVLVSRTLGSSARLQGKPHNNVDKLELGTELPKGNKY